MPGWLKMDLSPLVFRVLQRHMIVFARNWRVSISLNFIEPLLILTALGIGLGVYVQPIEGLPYLNYLAPGILASSAMFATTYECTYGTFVRLEYQKTFHAMVATPLSMDDVIMGEILWGTFKSIMYATIILLVITMLGLVASPWALLIPLVAAAAGLQFAVLSMLWIGLFPNIDSFNHFFSLFLTPLFLFSGVFFPLTGLHPLIQSLAWFSPLYHVVTLNRSLVLGDASTALLGHFIWLVVITSLLLPLTMNLMRRLVIK